DDRGRMLACLLEEIADAGGAYPDDHLDELGRAHREERHARLARDRPRKERLAGAGRPDEQHALRRGAAEARVLLWLLQEIHDLDELVLDLVDPRNVVEGDALVAFRVVAPGAAAADAHHPAEAAALLRGPAEQPDVERDDQDRGAEAEQQDAERRAAGVDRLRIDLHA